MSECCFFRRIMEITSSSQNKNLIFLLHFILDKSYHLASFFFFYSASVLCSRSWLSCVCLSLQPSLSLPWQQWFDFWALWWSRVVLAMVNSTYKQKESPLFLVQVGYDRSLCKSFSKVVFPLTRAAKGWKCQVSVVLMSYLSCSALWIDTLDRCCYLLTRNLHHTAQTWASKYLSGYTITHSMSLNTNTFSKYQLFSQSLCNCRI